MAMTSDVTDLLRRFMSLEVDVAALSLKLRPLRAEYDEVFLGSAAAAAHDVYESAWRAGSLVIRAPRADDVVVWSATTEELRDGKVDATGAFSTQWREAAAHLVPGRRFFAFRFLDASGSAVGEGEGLTHTTCGWRWFPNPSVAVSGQPFAALKIASIGSAALRPPRAPVRAPPAKASGILSVAIDREARDALLADLVVAPILAQVDVCARSAFARRAFLERGVRISRSAAPDIFRVVDAVRERLQLEDDVELYTGTSMAELGPALLPPVVDGKASLFLAPTILDDFQPAELSFIVGHELGHVALGHHALHPKLMVGRDDVPLALCARLFSWQRSAEVSADRVGLLCCGDLDVAVRCMFKITTGLRRADFANVHDLVVQQRELLLQERREEDWYRTHPWSPLRLTALDLFARSRLFRHAQGQPGGELSDSQLQAEIDSLLSFMNPPPIGGTEEEVIGRFVTFAGFLLIDGPADTAALKRLGATYFGEVGEAWACGREAFEEALLAAANGVALLVPLRRRIKVLEDLVSLAMLHDGVSESERAILIHLTRTLRLETSALEAAITRLSHPLD